MIERKGKAEFPGYTAEQVFDACSLSETWPNIDLLACGQLVFEDKKLTETSKAQAIGELPYLGSLAVDLFVHEYQPGSRITIGGQRGLVYAALNLNFMKMNTPDGSPASLLTFAAHAGVNIPTKWLKGKIESYIDDKIAPGKVNDLVLRFQQNVLEHLDNAT